MIDVDLSKCESIPVSALFAEQGHAKLHQPQLIIARDVRSRRVAMVYGMHVLDESATRAKAVNIVGLVVELDMGSTDMDRLLALVQSVKGKHDFQYGIEFGANQ